MPPYYLNVDGERLPVHPIVTVHLRAVDCLACITVPGGGVRAGNRGMAITDVRAHEQLARHVDYVEEDRHLHPNMAATAIAPGSPYRRAVDVLVHCCDVCSLNPTTALPRGRGATITDTTLADHVQGAQHARRMDDGRYDRWHQAGVPRA